VIAESVGSRRELVANSCTHRRRRRDATRQLDSFVASASAVCIRLDVRVLATATVAAMINVRRKMYVISFSVAVQFFRDLTITIIIIIRQFVRHRNMWHNRPTFVSGNVRMTGLINVKRYEN